MKHILSCLLIVCTCVLSQAQQSVLTCADFKEGSFIIPMGDNIPFETLIIRQGDEQREVVEINGEVSEATVKMVWTSDCTYELYYISSHNDPDFIDSDSFKETVTYVEITKIEDSCAYIIASATIKGEFVQMPGKMCKEELL